MTAPRFRCSKVRLLPRWRIVDTAFGNDAVYVSGCRECTRLVAKRLNKQGHAFTCAKHVDDVPRVRLA